ncbi:MAG TPA: hypothetical protein VHT70_01360 [Candidatus Saccharimonadales bacterium]|jgi:hypothetical protein|nr:hypothetical protein [Candidatus Saccharimonadales bacterium]
MNEVGPNPENRENLIANILNVGNEILDADPTTDATMIAEDRASGSVYRGTVMAVGDEGVMGISAPMPGDTRLVKLTVTEDLRIDDFWANHYSFWIDGSVDNLIREHVGMEDYRDVHHDVEDTELEGLEQRLRKIQGIVATRAETEIKE